MKTEGYSIKDLEVLSGIKAHTIRIWEKRYNLLNPERTNTNIRFYCDDDLRRMLNVSLLVKKGFKISKVANWEDNKITETVLSVSNNKETEEDYIEQLMLNMLNFEYSKFNILSNEIFLRFRIEEAVSTVFFKLLQRIGTFWQVGSVFPAQEHFVTHIIRQKLISEIEKLELPNSKSATVLFYLPENELHEISLLFYSYLARKYGYNVIYLGQFVPLNDLKKFKTHVKIDYVFSAFINSIQKKELEKYLVDLKNIFQQQKIFITGLQIQNHKPEIPRNVKIIKDYREFKRFLA